MPPSPATGRQLRLARLSAGEAWDCVVIGGGISGAPVYDALCRAGYRTALVDGGDFASGTSQASGMLIWGGLLYLKQADLPTILSLCRARNELLRALPGEIAPLTFECGRAAFPQGSTALMWLGLQLYWLLGRCALERPRRCGKGRLTWQEGMLTGPDSRFVLRWLLGHDDDHRTALNYCRLITAEYDASRQLWRLTVRDERTGTEYPLTARALINAAGVWVDEVNALLCHASPYRHFLSKGVYLAFPRTEADTQATIHPMQGADDVLTAVPWGPTLMWGPTETAVADPRSGFTPDREDIRFLLRQAPAALSRKLGTSDIISLRCGVRPLAIRKDARPSESHPLTLSRHHRVSEERQRYLLALYGGKLTGSISLAREVAKRVAAWFPPRLPPHPAESAEPELAPFPGLEGSFVSAKWARDHESCLTLEDYLRRRTPLAQWLPRMGFGLQGEHRATLLKLAAAFAPQNPEAHLAEYEATVRSRYDSLLADL